jgi:hypothetical protein
LLRFKIAPVNSVSLWMVNIVLYIGKMWDKVFNLAFLLFGIKGLVLEKDKKSFAF